MHGVFKRVLAADVTPALTEQLKAVGLDLTQPLAESYPRSVWFSAIEATASALFGAAPEPGSQQRQLGSHVMHALQSRHLLKGPWLTMAKLLGPRRALKQAADFGAENSPVNLEVKELNAKALEVTIDEGRQPEFLAGLLEALVTVLGGKNAAVSIVSATDARAVFTASWK